MLKHNDINPLNVFGLREMQHCPPHFFKVSFDLTTSEKRVKDWVYENLDGRFWLGDRYFTTSAGTTDMQKCVAFELHSEASYFSLFLDKVNSWDHKPFA
jgi:hypothetical protein